MNESTHNPTIPLELDLASLAFVVFWVFLLSGVLLSITRTDFDRSGAKFWWCALVIAVPVLGAAVWFLFGRPSRDSRSRT
ncbi:PLDc N-terminal domain-containing protein [Rhodococcus erythropolis]|uniref:PLDc N-terminal domain-containing protein n=1 Tax=Rhodococcus erythropolis TaxID=1833 RepID=UPI001BEAB694|nr:PLDc N-terminal domain-containing protein [Rhodococcus erythropolis]MBT2267663.1 PLDc N-terminal domain-containing protein [Rhodococcus erythropolis]